MAKKKIKDLTLGECIKFCQIYGCKECPLHHRTEFNILDCPIYEIAYLEREVEVDE